MPIVSGFNLTIDSALAIPGAAPLALIAGEPDVRVALLPAAPERAPAEPLYRLQDDILTFASREALYHCQTGEVAIAPRPDADPDAIVGLLIATALPAMLWLRGAFVLHAAAVVRPGGDGALAIMGPSGVGKSAVAAQLIAEGAMLLADDSLRLEPAGAAIMASGLPGGYHLAASNGAARDFHPLPPGRTMRRTTLGAALVLSRTQGAPCIRRLDPIDAIEHWLKGQHRPRIPKLLGRQVAALDFCAHLARQVPLYSWERSGAGLTGEERAGLRELAW